MFWFEWQDIYKKIRERLAMLTVKQAYILGKRGRKKTTF